MEDERDGGRDLKRRLTHWRSLLRRHAPQGQQILRKLIDGRLLMTPHPNHTPAYYTFEGTGTLVGLLAGIVPHKVASPTGLELNFELPPAEEVFGWLQRLETLKKTGRFRAA